MKTWEGGSGGEAGSWRRHKRSWHVRTYSCNNYDDDGGENGSDGSCDDKTEKQLMYVLVQLLFQSKPASISMEQVPFTPTVHWDALSQKAAKGALTPPTPPTQTGNAQM